MRPSDFISFIALFLSIFASIFSVIIYVKELEIEDQISHFHHNNYNITSIVRLDKDITHLFRTLGMENKRAERLRNKINANATDLATSTEGERGPAETDYRILSGSTPFKNSTAGPGKTFNSSEGEDK